MSDVEFWGLAIVLIIIAAIAGYAIGRRKAPGGPEEIQRLIAEYEEQLEFKKSEVESYKTQVHEHYDKTAELFKDMAGSYKDLFDHLSTGYEKLGNFSEQRILPARAGALLDEPDTDSVKEKNFINPNEKGDEDALTR